MMANKLKLKDLQAVILWKNSIGEVYDKKYVKNTDNLNGALVEFIEYGDKGRALQLQTDDTIAIIDPEEHFETIVAEFIIEDDEKRKVDDFR
jgi:hypothetical protein